MTAEIITSATDLERLPAGSVLMGQIHGRGRDEPLFLLDSRALMAADESWSNATPAGISVKFPLTLLWRP